MLTIKQLTTSDYDWVTALLKSTEQQVQDRIGHKITITLQVGKPPASFVEQLLGVVAEALSMSFMDYGNGQRYEEYVALRQIGAALAKHHTNVKLKPLARIMGLGDHSSVIHCVNMCRQRVGTKEPYFCDLYKKAEEAVILWKLNKHNPKHDNPEILVNG